MAGLLEVQGFPLSCSGKNTYKKNKINNNKKNSKEVCFIGNGLFLKGHNRKAVPNNRSKNSPPMNKLPIQK